MANYYEYDDYPPCPEGQHKRAPNGRCHPCGIKADYNGFSEAESERRALRAENKRLRAELEKAQLRSIEARNPGIDMDEVRRIRAEQEN